jgi:hypothetical protein
MYAISSCIRRGSHGISPPLNSGVRRTQVTASAEQFARVERALARVRSNRDRDLVAYEDDVRNFFQNAWHLKDWVKNDPELDAAHRDKVEGDVARIEALQICADLANRSKHLKLERKRLDADISKRSTHIYAGAEHLSLDGTGASTPGHGELIFTILAADGREFGVLETAAQAVEEWRTLLKRYGVPVG